MSDYDDRGYDAAQEAGQEAWKANRPAYGERVEPDMRAAARAHFHYTDPDERDWDTLPAVLQEDRIREISIAVDAAIGGKLLVDPPTEEAMDDENLRFHSDARRTEEE